MIRDLPGHLPNATLLSLDFDLIPDSKSTGDPGSGLDVCAFLATQDPVCPIILHSSNEQAVWEMLFKLGEGNWETDWLRHDPLGVVWIGTLWLPKVRSYLARNCRSGQAWRREMAAEAIDEGWVRLAWDDLCWVTVKQQQARK